MLKNVKYHVKDQKEETEWRIGIVDNVLTVVDQHGKQVDGGCLIYDLSSCQAKTNIDQKFIDHFGFHVDHFKTVSKEDILKLLAGYVLEKEKQS